MGTTGITNQRVAEVLYEIADLLETKSVRFKPIAYRKAAKAVMDLREDIGTVTNRGDLETIPGVGEHIGAKIHELVTTGNLPYLESLRKEIPEGLVELAGIEGIGPKRATLLNRELGISDIQGLEEAAKAGKIRTLPGFGERSEQKLLHAIRLRQESKGRFLLGDILPVADEIVRQLASHPSARQVTIAGSARRRKETIGDLDLLATSPEPEGVMDLFSTLPAVRRIVGKGPTRSTVVLASGLQVDLRVVAEASFGAALQYFTGSKDHNIALRRRASEKNWRLNEYGLTDLADGRVVAGSSEEEVYRALGLLLIPPELRENRGEIEAAEEGTLPALVGYDAVKGDLRVRSSWSSGSLPLTKIALAAKEMGYSYLAVCDHAKDAGIPRGLTAEDVATQQKEIEGINRVLDDFSILSGIECSIMHDGKLNLPSSVLDDLDIVIAGIHTGFSAPEKEMTRRLVAAIHNDSVDVLAHPTGRIIGKRDPVQADISAVSYAAAATGTLLEIDACRNRLDLTDENCRLAKERHARFSIGTGARNAGELQDMHLGIATARRGWLGAADIANTLPEKDLRTLLGR